MILCALVFLFILVFNCRLFSFVTRSLRFVLCSRFLVGFWAARRKGAGEKLAEEPTLLPTCSTMAAVMVLRDTLRTLRGIEQLLYCMDSVFFSFFVSCFFFLYFDTFLLLKRLQVVEVFFFPSHFNFIRA